MRNQYEAADVFFYGYQFLFMIILSNLNLRETCNFITYIRVRPQQLNICSAHVTTNTSQYKISN